MVKDNSMSSKVFDVIIHVTLFILLVLTLYPFLHIVSVSLSDSMEVAKGNVSFYPKKITFDAYKIIIETGIVPRGLKNSIIYTIVGTIINVFMTVLMAYPLSKKRLPLKKFYMVFMVITMYFSGGLIPQYILVVDWLNLYNSMWALILPGCISAFNVIVLRTFFQSIPEEFSESAIIDGANDIYILWKIILPVSKAGLATIALFYAVGHWNSFFAATLYLESTEKYPLQVILRNVVIKGQVAAEMMKQGNVIGAEQLTQQGNTMQESIKYATVFFSMMPMLIVYPFIQKYFVKGLMIGSLKG